MYRIPLSLQVLESAEAREQFFAVPGRTGSAPPGARDHPGVDTVSRRSCLIHHLPGIRIALLIKQPICSPKCPVPLSATRCGCAERLCGDGTRGAMGLGRPESGTGGESLDERCLISEGEDPLGTARRSVPD